MKVPSFLQGLSKKWLMLFGVAAVVLALILGIGVTAMMDPYDCRIAPGVKISGLDVGGMTQTQAKKALREAAAQTLMSRELTISLPEETLTVLPSTAKLQLSIRDAVKTAYSYGRTTAELPEDLDIGLLPFLSIDEEALRALLKGYAGRWDSELTQPQWALEGDMPELRSDLCKEGTAGPTLRLTMGTPDCHLDVEGILSQIRDVYDRGIDSFREGSCGITPEVTLAALPKVPDMKAIYGELCVAPVNDSLDMTTYKPVAGAFGCHFDLEAATAQAAAAAYGETLSIPMVCFPPEIIGEGVYFRDVLGSCETKHNDNENRNANLKLLCKTLDGYVIQPGESFSYNEVLGERTAARGYKPAPAYSGNRMIQDYGGGVCQGSTTLYNCLLLADMEIVERNGHGAWVSYVKLGLDAAVNWNTKTDLIFRNNSHFPVKILAEVSDGYVKMKLVGTDEKDYYIEMQANSWDEGRYWRATSYKCKYDKKTGEQISRDLEARSVYYKGI